MSPHGAQLVHHELCFGCGRTNLFGLLIEAERSGDGDVHGRWFVKQDHQGPRPGTIHPGLLACALIEVSTLAAGDGRVLSRIELELEPERSGAIGSFCDIAASAESSAAGGTQVAATASLDGHPLARLRADVSPG